MVTILQDDPGLGIEGRQLIGQQLVTYLIHGPWHARLRQAGDQKGNDIAFEFLGE
jgi:hypothetical protein